MQPAASAGATPRAGIASGKFHGETIRQGPTGRLVTTNSQSPSGWASRRPEIRTASSAFHSRYSAAKVTSSRASVRGLPDSRLSA